MRLKDKIAIVVGGVSGIGKAIAERFVKEGAIVIAADLNEARLPESQTELAALGNKGYTVKMDMTDPVMVQNVVDGVIENYGRLDIIVCSGGASWHVPFEKITNEEWTNMIHMHLDSSFYLAKAVTPAMMSQKWGRIIFISSGHGLRGMSGKVHYSAAKGGVIAFARALGSELGPYGITVNTIAPGVTLTSMVASQYSEEALAAMANAMPDKQLAQPEDMAAMAVLLASDEGKHLNCHTWAVDGGDTVANAKRN